MFIILFTRLVSVQRICLRLDHNSVHYLYLNYNNIYSDSKVHLTASTFRLFSIWEYSTNNFE